MHECIFAFSLSCLSCPSLLISYLISMMPPASTANIAYAYVGLGSNLGDRAGNLLLAVRGMMSAGLRVRRLSSIYETEPVDVIDQPSFLNMVAELANDT